MEEGEEDGHGQGGDQGAGRPVPEHGAWSTEQVKKDVLKEILE